LRPLCAKHLPAPLPEREGWVDREKLYDFHGRNRKPQIELARRYGFEDWAQPAGGCCFLTNADYSAKLKDLWDARGERDYELDDIMLLKVGRHLRPAPHFKVIIGREQGENNYLEGYKNTYISLTPSSHRGPFALIDGQANAADIELAARIVGRYSQGRDAPSFSVRARLPDGAEHPVTVTPLPSDDIPEHWHV
jgi:hypothetical protein